MESVFQEINPNISFKKITLDVKKIFWIKYVVTKLANLKLFSRGK